MLAFTWLWLSNREPLTTSGASVNEWAYRSACAAMDCFLENKATARYSTSPEIVQAGILPCGRELWGLQSFVDCQTTKGEWVRIHWLAQLDCDRTGGGWHMRNLWANGEQIYHHVAPYDLAPAAAG